MTVIGFSEGALFRLHPTAIRIDSDFVIQSFGPIANRYAPKMRAGERLSQSFDIMPELINGSLASLTTGKKALSLVSKERGIRLTGVVFATEADYLIVIRPQITDVRNPKGLQIADFPEDDPLIQCLMQIALLQGLRDEAEAAAQELKLAWEENAEILDQLRSITGFIAHEFSNLLSIISLNCERIRSLHAIGTDSARMIDFIQEAALRGGSVSQWLRALSGDADLSHREPLDDFLRANLNLLKTLCGPNVTVSPKLMAGGASLDAPICSLLNCLVSLIRMAAPPDEFGIHAEIETVLADTPVSAPRMVEVTIRIEANHVLDGGELLHRRRSSFLGHQTGRASVSEFVRSVGGSAQYRSSGENAAVITMQMPCANESERVLHSHAANPDRAGRDRQHLIVVEDEPAALEALVELLEFEGFTVTACCNAEQALTALAARPNSILITDVVLPTIDGLALAKKAALTNPQIKVVIMSGHIPDRDHHDQQWVFLQKPLNVDDLIASIAQAEQ